MPTSANDDVETQPDTRRPESDPWRRVWVEFDWIRGELNAIAKRLDALENVPQGPIRVLVVDDDEMMRKVLQRLLTSANMDVLCVEDGNKAIDLMRSNAFDVVLTDLLMPGNGGTLLKHLTAKHPEMAVVLMTGFSEDRAASEALQSQAFDYLPKPFPSNNRVVLTITRAAEFRRRLRLPT